MKWSLCIVQLLCLICTLTYSEFVQNVFSKSDAGSNNGILKEILTTIGNHPGQTFCAIACMEINDCQSFTYNDSTGICQLQENGYGEWTGNTGKTYWYQ